MRPRPIYPDLSPGELAEIKHFMADTLDQMTGATRANDHVKVEALGDALTKRIAGVPVQHQDELVAFVDSLKQDAMQKFAAEQECPVDLRDEWVFRILSNKMGDWSSQMDAMLGDRHLEDMAICVSRMPGREEIAFACTREGAIELAEACANLNAKKIMSKRAGRGQIWIFAIVGQQTRCVSFDISKFAESMHAHP